MKPERYEALLGEFDALTDLGAAVSAKLVGTLPEPMHLNYLDAIFAKLLEHAICLRRIAPNLSSNAAQIWPLASECAVARSLIEAHDVLCYMAHPGEGEDEREFRVLLWRLHDGHRRIKMVDAIGSSHPEAERIRSEAIKLQQQISTHRWFPRLSKEKQRKVASGDAPPFTLTQREMNERNEVNHDYHTAATMFLSQYVHTFPMSIHQLRAFRAGTDDALRMVAMPLQYACGFLASATIRMAETFPAGATRPRDDQAVAFMNWLNVVRRGVKL